MDIFQKKNTKLPSDLSNCMSLDPRRLQQQVDLPQTREGDTLTNYLSFMFLTPSPHSTKSWLRVLVFPQP